MNLVTGATGLIGAHMALHLLQAGESVRALYREPSRIARTKALFELYQAAPLFEKIEWHQADLCDIPALEPAFENIVSVYHCAGFISFNAVHEKPLRKTNIEGTANIVNCALAFGVKKLCHVSSIAALGEPKPGETKIDETAEWNPEKARSYYAISKYGAEIEVWRAQQEGLSTVIVNPSVVLGPGFWDSGSGAIFSTIEKGFPFYTDGATGFVAVTDVVNIMHRLTKSEIENERFILVSETVAFHDIANRAADALGVKRPAYKASPAMTQIARVLDYAASFFNGGKRKLPKETRAALHHRREFSSAKLQKVLPFEFTPVLPYIDHLVALEKKKGA